MTLHYYHIWKEKDLNSTIQNRVKCLTERPVLAKNFNDAVKKYCEQNKIALYRFIQIGADPENKQPMIEKSRVYKIEDEALRAQDTFYDFQHYLNLRK